MLAGTQHKACLPETARGLFVPPGDRGRTAHALAGRDVPCPGPTILLAHEGRGRERLCQANPGCACSCPANMACTVPGAPAASLPLLRAGAPGLGHPVAVCARLAPRGGVEGRDCEQSPAWDRSYRGASTVPGEDAHGGLPVARRFLGLHPASCPSPCVQEPERLCHWGVPWPGWSGCGMKWEPELQLCKDWRAEEKQEQANLLPQHTLRYGGNVLVWGLISAPLPPLWLSNIQLGRGELMHCI